MVPNDIAALHREFTHHEIGGLNAVGSFINRGNAYIAIKLRCARFLNKAHSAMHLNTERGDLAAHVGAVGLGKRRQQINHLLRPSFAERGTVNIA